MDAKRVMRSFNDLSRYIEDFARMSGGQMREKYGDDPMVGFDNILRRTKNAERQIKVAMGMEAEPCDSSLTREEKP